MSLTDLPESSISSIFNTTINEIKKFEIESENKEQEVKLKQAEKPPLKRTPSQTKIIELLKTVEPQVRYKALANLSAQLLELKGSIDFGKEGQIPYDVKKLIDLTIDLIKKESKTVDESDLKEFKKFLEKKLLNVTKQNILSVYALHEAVGLLVYAERDSMK